MREQLENRIAFIGVRISWLVRQEFALRRVGGFRLGAGAVGGGPRRLQLRVLCPRSPPGLFGRLAGVMFLTQQLFPELLRLALSAEDE